MSGFLDLFQRIKIYCIVMNDQEIYESCDFVIEMIDSCYWEVFSKDVDPINRLATKVCTEIFLD